MHADHVASLTVNVMQHAPVPLTLKPVTCVHATAIYAGCFQDPGCGPDGDEAEGDMKLLAENAGMTPLFCWQLAQVRGASHGCGCRCAAVSTCWIASSVHAA
jgi:hypothetical protein